MQLAGMIVMAIGAWQRSLLVIVFGVVVILAGWLRGVIAPNAS